MNRPMTLIACTTLLLMLLATPLAADLECPPAREGPRVPIEKQSYGCSNGYCWSWCLAVGIGKEWCYTTDGRGLSEEEVRRRLTRPFAINLSASLATRVPCTSDQDCCEWWKCSSACTV